MRILGIDLGKKNIGIAISDESAVIAQSYGIVKRVRDDRAVKEIMDIAAAYEVSEIVVGLPLNMDGSRGASARDSMGFADRLKKDSGIKIVLWDERLSTKEAEDMMLAADLSRRKRKSVVDKIAAQLILQGYLDSCAEKRKT